MKVFSNQGMRLGEVLSEFSMPKLTNLIQVHGGRIPKSFYKKDMIEQLSALIIDPVNLKKKIFSIPGDEIKILGVVLICEGKIEHSRLSIFERENASMHNFSYYINNLQSRGLLYIKYDRNDATIIIPDELKAPLRDLLIEYKPCDEIADMKLERMETSPIIEDIFRISLFSNNKDGIRLTQGGNIFKKLKEQLFKMLCNNSEDRLGYAVSLMMKCDLLDKDTKSNSLRMVNENAIKTIFSKSKETITSEHILPLVTSSKLNNDYVRNFLKSISNEKEEIWIDYWDFIITRRRAFFENKDVKGWLNFDLYDLTRLFYNLHFLGLMDMKMFRDNNQMIIQSFKISTFGKQVYGSENGKDHAEYKSDRPFIISPNFEINVFPEETDYYTIFRLSKIAQIIKCDTVCTFRIEKEFILRQLTEGSKLKDIISFLEGHSKKELPQNVAYSLYDWGSKYGKVSVSKGCIEIIDRSLYERVEQILSPFIIRSTDNPVIFFDDKNADEVKLRLRKSDIFPSNWKKDDRK